MAIIIGLTWRIDAYERAEGLLPRLHRDVLWRRTFIELFNAGYLKYFVAL